MKSIFVLLSVLAVHATAQIGEGDNAGSCYDVNSQGQDSVYCAVEESLCLAGPSDDGQNWFFFDVDSFTNFPPVVGCCHCCAGCNLTAEAIRTGGANCEPFRGVDGECGHVGGPSENSTFFQDSSSGGDRITSSVSAAFLLLVSLYASS
mmetsp:Transcript_11743/g.13514  ORF Transcript_11743/g.13514 Transcript_11743/m.13514 type:complete len:149 (-) Transcript_11743:128-574(-)